MLKKYFCIEKNPRYTVKKVWSYLNGILQISYFEQCIKIQCLRRPMSKATLLGGMQQSEKKSPSILDSDQVYENVLLFL